MTLIENDNDFIQACDYLVTQDLLPVQGSRFVDPFARKVFDERGTGIENLIDITPDTPTLEAALDSANAAMATQVATATEDTNERATLLQQAAAALTQIGNDLTAIGNGKTAATNATTLAQMRTVVLGMLDVLEHQCNRDEREIKALRAIIRNGLG
jgi:hypothetical protein